MTDNPHPNARRLIAIRSAQEAREARERALEAAEIIDSGRAQDSSEFLRDRLTAESVPRGQDSATTQSAGG